MRKVFLKSSAAVMVFGLFASSGGLAFEYVPKVLSAPPVHEAAGERDNDSAASTPTEGQPIEFHSLKNFTSDDVVPLEPDEIDRMSPEEREILDQLENNGRPLPESYDGPVDDDQPNLPEKESAAAAPQEEPEPHAPVPAAPPPQPVPASPPPRVDRDRPLVDRPGRDQGPAIDRMDHQGVLGQADA